MNSFGCNCFIYTTQSTGVSAHDPERPELLGQSYVGTRYPRLRSECILIPCEVRPYRKSPSLTGRVRARENDL
jgi:hypothetical protein